MTQLLSRRFFQPLALLLLSLTLSTVAAESLATENQTRQGLGYYQLNDSNLALQGYSPVSYFIEGKAELGTAEFQSTLKGVTYYFTSAAQKALFDAQPEKYEPAHGGWCSVMMAGSGNRVIADPERFKIVDDKLLVFYRGVAPNGAKVDGGAIWEQRTRSGDPKKQARNESRMLKKADQTWREIRAGKRRSQIIDA